MARTRRNQKAGGFFDWLFGKKNEVVANGATVPVENPVPTNATVVQVNEVATPISNVVGGARKTYKARKGRKDRKGRKATKAQRKSRKGSKGRKGSKSRKAQH